MTPIELAVADLGYTEEPPGSNRTKYGERFFPGQPSEWCAEFVSCTTKDAGATGPWNASVGFYQEQGRTEGRLTDLAGAMLAIREGKCVSIGFEWEHDSWPDHIGWLLNRVDDGHILTLEGNSPGGDGVDEVAYHTRPTSLVAFYCVIDVAASPVQPDVDVPAPAPVHPDGPRLPDWMFLTWHPNGRPGFTNHGDKVAVWQDAVNRLGGPWSCGVDGVIGPETNDRIYRMQRANGLEEDGIVGQDTWRVTFPSA